MKKSTKKTIMALAIIIIFGLSSLAFVFSGISAKQEGPQQLTGFVVDGEIDPSLENTYIQNGFTFLKFYHDEAVSTDIVKMIEQAPDSFKTPTDQKQLIVLKINATSTYAKIVNINGEYDIPNLTSDTLFEALCSRLVAAPTECVISALNFTG